MTEHLLFSYGTLRRPGVQRSVFGRELDGHPDEITGYELGQVTITDAAVIAASGSAEHPVLRPASGESGIPGMVYEVGDDDLRAADAYEVDDYTRILVPLRSGARAWVYVLAESANRS
ncbi:gamma-glutamylcyclotransferase family protein [Nocardia sp. NPDC057227]|uniref:gamma-glutamylcyclotransferase family protein n=1 Tax=Nocardia sp. NPDC057227 TaxID=3346056 RepID=UPI0036286227